MSGEAIRNGVVYLIGLILSICVHEFGHAFVADKLGDPLPRAQGRVTLNPIAHIDPIGTLLMPILMIMFPGSPLLGWGKPVQVSLSARHMTRRFSIKVSHAFIAVAGPMMNVLFGLFLSGVYVLLLRFTDGYVLAGFVGYVIGMNIALACFNLIPCPPLDGGAILHGVLPRDLEWITDALKTYGFIILFALLYSGAIGKIMGPVVGLADAWLQFLARAA
jgi:Zn-dependent protease